MKLPFQGIYHRLTSGCFPHDKLELTFVVHTSELDLKKLLFATTANLRPQFTSVEHI
jgi:hypothetical protein